MCVLIGIDLQHRDGCDLTQLFEGLARKNQLRSLECKIFFVFNRRLTNVVRLLSGDGLFPSILHLCRASTELEELSLGYYFTDNEALQIFGALDGHRKLTELFLGN